MLTLLTATGSRPNAWAICEQYMNKQDYQGSVKWIIVDDGEIAQTITFKRDNWELVVVRPDPFWKHGENTQARNLLAGLEHVSEKENLVIIEDDDRYASDWLSVVEKKLEKAELVGECLARYYNIQLKTGRQLKNQLHASLCSTAMRGSAIKTFIEVCKSNVKFIDIKLWAGVKQKMLFTGNRVVGIKGLPGRGGIGMGHDINFSGNKDTSLDLLRSWIGSDLEYYFG
jgi:hypothetical protein